MGTTIKKEDYEIAMMSDDPWTHDDLKWSELPSTFPHIVALMIASALSAGSNLFSLVWRILLDWCEHKSGDDPAFPTQVKAGFLLGVSIIFFLVMSLAVSQLLQ